MFKTIRVSRSGAQGVGAVSKCCHTAANEFRRWMMLVVLALVLAATSPATPALSQAAAASNASTGKPAKVAVQADTIVCKSVIATGTRFTTKDCRTKREWDDMAAESHQLVSTSQGSGQAH